MRPRIELTELAKLREAGLTVARLTERFGVSLSTAKKKAPRPSSSELADTGVTYIYWHMILRLWGIILLCAAIDAAMMKLNDGKFPQPISYHWWTSQLLRGPESPRHR